MQFFYDEGELRTVSLDGHIKVWWYEKIDQADPPDDDRVILLDPSCDFYIPGTMLYCIEKQYVDQFDNTEYFAQVSQIYVINSNYFQKFYYSNQRTN